MKTVAKSVRMPVWLVEKIESMAEEEERTFTQQVILLLRKGVKLHAMTREAEEEIMDTFINKNGSDRQAQ